MVQVDSISFQHETSKPERRRIMSSTAATPAATASPPRSWMGIDVAKQTFEAAIWTP